MRVRGHRVWAKAVAAGLLLLSLNLGVVLAATLPVDIPAAASSGLAGHASADGSHSDATGYPAHRDRPGSAQTQSGVPPPNGTPNPRLGYHVPILMYHRIVPVSNAGNSLRSMVVQPEAFSAQLKTLRDAGWRTLTLGELGAYMRTGRPAPGKSFVITIDDGWADGYTYALPIMRGFGYTATYFVIAGRIGTDSMLSVAQLHALELAGNEIGNHTQSHVDLVNEKPARARQEIDQGSEGIARAMGHRPVSFAYPMGRVAPWVAALVAATPDLQIAATTARGPEIWGRRYEMPRIEVNASTDPILLLAALVDYR